MLSFDLSVLGMEVTSPESAEFVVSGHDNGRFEGSLTPAGAAHPLWTKPTPAA